MSVCVAKMLRMYIFTNMPTNSQKMCCVVFSAKFDKFANFARALFADFRALCKYQY